MQELMLGGLLVLTIAWLVVRIRQNMAADNTASVPAKKQNESFHAVSIKSSENACDAAKAITGRRFLSSEAPQLPLPKCDYHDCHCKFVHYDDRRAGRDRRSPFAASGSGSATGTHRLERREDSDRRTDSD